MRMLTEKHLHRLPQTVMRFVIYLVGCMGAALYILAFALLVAWAPWWEIPEVRAAARYIARKPR